jgi:hypothetical protein
MDVRPNHTGRVRTGRLWVQIPLLSLVLVSSCARPQDRVASKVIAGFGSTPLIDGVIGAREWSDATRITLDSTKTVYLKRDQDNLYVALNGDGGNLYFLKGDRIYVLHASWSLGWAEYAKANDHRWRCEKEFEWELYRIQEKVQEDVQTGISGYLRKNGWVGSIVPMGREQQTEFAVSFRWLNVDGDNRSSDLLRIPKVFISSFQNLHPAERERRGLSVEDLELRWPSAAVPDDSLGRGYAPANINMDVSDWGDIFVEL